jgi:hypothetical protein
MTRYGINALVAIRLAEAGRGAADGDRLVAPTVLRTDVLRLLYRQVAAGEREERDALELVRTVAGTPMRLLGDKVSMRTAWGIAKELGLDDPAPAAYLAVTRLQADAFVALDPDLVRIADGVVPAAPAEVLLG